MAKKPAPKPVKKRVNPRRRKKAGDTNAAGILFIMALMVLAFFSRQAAQLIAMGLLPTIVLGFTVKGTFKGQRTMSVGFANAAGISMLVGEVWTTPSAFDRVITEASTWIIMWGSAGLGYALIYVGPMIAAMIMQSLAQDRIKSINQQKQELVELWGHELLENKDDDNSKQNLLPRRPGR